MKVIKYTLMFILLIAAELAAQQEFIVNTITDSTQRAPVAAGEDASGNYAIVWQSASASDASDIYMQPFNKSSVKSGTELRVNEDTGGLQSYPAAAMNRGGNMIVAWTSNNGDLINGGDIKARLYKNFMPVTPEFTVNTVLARTQTSPAAAIYDDGSFVITWESWDQDGSDRGVYAQMFDAAGNKKGQEIQINVTTANSQARPAVEYFSDGSFVIAWESWTNNVAGYDVMARLFNSAGQPLTGEVRVNTATADYQWMPDIAVNRDNSFSIVWCSWEQDGDDGGIFLQKFAYPTAAKTGGEICVNSTTRFYQWLPKVKYFNDDRIGVMWSSWKQDDSREGVYFRALDSELNAASLEERINDVTEGYQWEPDFFINSSGEVISTYSSWGLIGKDYEVMSKVFKPAFIKGFLNENKYEHPQGRTTSDITVFVTDSLKLNGSEYEVSFDSTAQKVLSMTVKNMTEGRTSYSGLLLNKSDNVFYATPAIDGIIVNVKPVFSLTLNTAKSYFRNTTESNLNFRIDKPASGKPLLAPIDVAVIWNKTDTAGGKYLFPADTAFNTSMKKDIVIPFKVWNITDNQKIDCLIPEPAATKNKKWDPNENIIIITPEGYRSISSNTHVQIYPQIPSGSVILPSQGDTNYIFTSRPLTSLDRFSFKATGGDLVVDVENNDVVNKDFCLYQNYPNPFNPATFISYKIPADSFVELKVYDILGKEVMTLVNEVQKAGSYKKEITGRSTAMSSGVYFYRLMAKSTAGARSFVQTRKMVYLK